MIEIGSIVQVDPSKEVFGGCLVVITEVSLGVFRGMCSPQE